MLAIGTMYLSICKNVIISFLSGVIFTLLGHDITLGGEAQECFYYADYSIISIILNVIAKSAMGIRK
jgi:hypothetical protein